MNVSANYLIGSGLSYPPVDEVGHLVSKNFFAGV